jgi:hypothetical protein
MSSVDFNATRWWRPLERGDRWSLAIIVGLPILIFSVPALLGHPALAQDNLIQNFPLRVLTGQQLDSGHLPLLNPLSDSGTPLLGGMNAGSFFPGTLIFAVLPAILSWVLNLIAVYVASALGMFALLRWHGLRTLPSLVPALVFTYSGAMIGQIVHLGVVQGFAMLPWGVLIMLRMARAIEDQAPDATWFERLRALAPTTTAFAVLWGLISLTGEPRAFAEMELLTLIVGPIVLLVRSSWWLTTWRNRVLYVVGVGVGVGWGVLIGLAQLLPGLSFIDISQRTGLTYQFFGAGSLTPEWASLLFIPDIFGGNGALHQPSYFVNYNLPEVTGYVGVLALVATFAFLSRLTRRGWRGGDRNYVVYLAIAVVGLLATWGNFTPLGHIFRAIPLFGSTRLQSRNVVLVDFGLTALLGWWLQRLAERDVAGAGLGGRRKWVTLSPALVTGALCVAMLTVGAAIVEHLGATTSEGALAHFEWPTLVLHLAIALTIVGLLVWTPTSPRLLRRLTIVTAIDVVLFLTFCSLGFASGHVNPEPPRAPAVSVLGAKGRFALVDPSGAHQDVYEDLGSPNMNVFTGLASVQGYGSLINEIYGNETGTHPRFNLNPCQLAQGTFKQLRLYTVIVSSQKLATSLVGAQPKALRCLPIVRQQSQQRLFGQLLDVRSVVVVGAGGGKVTTGPISAQLLNATGKPFGAVVTKVGRPRVVFNFSRYRERAAGVVVSASFGALITSTKVVPRGGPADLLNTPFQQALSDSSWRLVDTSGTVSIFHASTLRASDFLAPPGTTSHIISIQNSTWGDSWITVDARRPVVLKRSEEWIPGWRATAVNVRTKKAVTLHVVRSGLIQQVLVPKGEWDVHFHYHAPHIEEGLLGSAVGLLALAVSGTYLWVRRPTRRNGKVQP